MIKSRAISVKERQKSISINRALSLPLRVVWRAWSDPESFKKWWGLKEFTCSTSLIDFKTGGENFSSMKGPDGREYWTLAYYREIILYKKILYTECFVDYKGHEVPPSFYDLRGDWSEVNVTVSFEGMNGKTNLTLCQTGIPKEMVDDYIQGWQSSFNKLEENLQ